MGILRPVYNYFYSYTYNYCQCDSKAQQRHDEILETLAHLKQQVRELGTGTNDHLNRMETEAVTTKQDFLDAIATVDTETTRLGTLIQTLTDKIQTGGMSADEEADTLAQLKATGDRLKLIGVNPDVPVPPVTP